MEQIFWLSLGLVGYVYLGYPALAWLLARVVGTCPQQAPIEPSVTVLIAAHNEVADIVKTVENKLAQDYPADKLDVIVVSDASTDGTDEAVAALGPRVRLLRQEPQAGKTAALNLALGQATGDILVLSDANSLYDRQAVRRLVRNFADERVGYVTGKMVYTSADGSLVGDGCSAYMRYENFIREQESRLASVIGVDGGIDAVRRELFRPLRHDQQSDFVIPLAVSGQGLRVVYEKDALLREEALGDHESEYRMRVRVSLRAMWALLDQRRLLSPMRRPMLAWQIWSHKVLRYGAFAPIALGFVSCAVLATASVFYLLLLAAGLAFVATGAWVWSRGGRGSRLALFPYYLLLLNVSACHAFFKLLAGERRAVWVPRTG